ARGRPGHGRRSAYRTRPDDGERRTQPGRAGNYPLFARLGDSPGWARWKRRWGARRCPPPGQPRLSGSSRGLPPRPPPSAARPPRVPAHRAAILAGRGATMAGRPAPADLIIDALIGYSLRSDPAGAAAELITWANDQVTPVLALDTPSGLDLTTGVAGTPAVSATTTLTLALPKVGLLDAPSVGALYLHDISVPSLGYQRIG